MAAVRASVGGFDILSRAALSSAIVLECKRGLIRDLQRQLRAIDWPKGLTHG
jgi:hypothetical protein